MRLPLDRTAPEGAGGMQFLVADGRTPMKCSVLFRRLTLPEMDEETRRKLGIGAIGILFLKRI